VLQPFTFLQAAVLPGLLEAVVRLPSAANLNIDLVDAGG
jgi:hypothetical protein